MIGKIFISSLFFQIKVREIYHGVNSWVYFSALHYCKTWSLETKTKPGSAKIHFLSFGEGILQVSIFIRSVEKNSVRFKAWVNWGMKPENWPLISLVSTLGCGACPWRASSQDFQSKRISMSWANVKGSFSKDLAVLQSVCLSQSLLFSPPFNRWLPLNKYLFA